MRIVGAGSGGHGRVVLNSLMLMGGFDMVGWTDPDTSLAGRVIDGFPILGNNLMLPDLRQDGVEGAFVGIGSTGSNARREALFTLLEQHGFALPQICHPAATVAETVTLGNGTAVMAGAIVNPGVKVGKNVIINTGAIIDHDCVVGDHVHVAPGVTLSGGVSLGDRCHIGTGATVIQGVSIGDGAIVGAGAVVLADVAARTTVYGVPARPAQERGRTRG